MFLLPKEDHSRIAAALQQLRAWNPTWKPAFVVIDKSEAELKALPTVFGSSGSGFQIILCNFHRLQAVWRWLNNEAHTPSMTYDNRRKIFIAFQGLGEIWQPSHYNNLRQYFKETVVKDQQAVAEYFEGNWFNCEKQWALCFRRANFNGMNTNNACESVNRSVKAVLLHCFDKWVDTIFKTFVTSIVTNSNLNGVSQTSNRTKTTRCSPQLNRLIAQGTTGWTWQRIVTT